MNPVDWRGCAARFSSRISRADLEPVALACLDSLSDGEPVGVACSGGADSVFLVLLLESLRRPGPSWTILHFDHGVRGAESAEDAAFVKALADGLGLGCLQGSATFGRDATEDQLRVARFAFLHQSLEAIGASVLFLGHQADDVAESILIRLARGSGSAGLAAPRPVQTHRAGIRHVRPLLNLGRKQIHSILAELQIPWREDSSNAADHHLRNRLRQTVIPAWETAEGREIRTGALLSRRILEDEDDALDRWLGEVLRDDAMSAMALHLGVLNGRPRALWRRAIDRWARRQPGLSGISRSWVERLVTAGIEGTELKVSAGPGSGVQLKDHLLSFVPEAPGESCDVWPECTLVAGSSVILPSGAAVGAKIVRIDRTWRERILGGAVDPDSEAWLTCPDGTTCLLHLRPWRPGDRYRPLGSEGTIKIGDQFTNRKISVERRSILPVICWTDGQPVWCPGLPPVDHLRVNEATIHAVQLTYCWHPSTFQL